MLETLNEETIPVQSIQEAKFQIDQHSSNDVLSDWALYRKKELTL